MNKFTRRVRPLRRILFDLRIAVALLGAVLSVVLHEAVHLLVHAGNITNIAVLPNNAALVEIAAHVPEGYSTAFEEAIAYLVTFLVLLATAALIVHASDAKSPKSFSDTIAPPSSPLHGLSTSELFELATKARII